MGNTISHKVLGIGTETLEAIDYAQVARFVKNRYSIHNQTFELWSLHNNHMSRCSRHNEITRFKWDP